MNAKEFTKKYCVQCGTQVCGGVDDVPWRDGCPYYKSELAKGLWSASEDVPINPENSGTGIATRE